jgi:hypothetical protein
VGSPRPSQAAGTGYFFASVTGSPHPTGPARSHDPCAFKHISGAFESCAARERQVARPVSRRRAARPTGPPIPRKCGARRHPNPCVSEYQRPPALQDAPSLPIRAPRLAMPTAPAHMTRARGLHATRSTIRSDCDTSSLPDPRSERRFFLFRWHRAHTCHTGNVSHDTTSTPTNGLVPRRVRLACPIMGTYARQLGRGVRALRVPPM